jgi:glycosyltransferase involved in cell wall biosynthesis
MVLPAIAKKTRELAIDILWAGHYGPLQLCLAVPGIPVVYTLHDWMHSIGAMKSRAGIVDSKAKSEEFAYIAKAAGVACVSSADIHRVEEISSAVVRHVSLVPAFKVTSNNIVLSQRARIVHLGNLTTTATRLGLLRFFDVVWPLLGACQSDVDVIGGGAGDETRDVLSRVRYHGFVENLGDRLAFGDIHVIPWEHATGVRTRVSLALCFGQVIVAVRSGVAGSPELEDGYNCILVDKLEEMADAILRLSENIEERTRIGRAAKLTAERLQASNNAGAAINDLLAGASCKKH